MCENISAGKSKGKIVKKENSEDRGISILSSLFFGYFCGMKRILERNHKNTRYYSKLKGESDASDSPKYAPQRRTAIHIYSIQELDKKCKVFYVETNFFN